MTQKKHKKADRRSSKLMKKNSRVAGRANRKLFIGVAVVTVLVAGLIMAMVNNQASPPATNTAASSPKTAPGSSPNTAARSSPAQQDAPKFTVTVNPPAATAVAEGAPAPDFTLQDLNGRPVQLSKLRGRVVVVNFWATWCGPCRAEIPGFVKAYEQYQPKGLEIVGVSLDHAGRDVVQDFVKKNGIGYPVALDAGQIAQQYGGVTGIPTTFVVDRQGRIAKKHIGSMDQSSFEAMIKPLL
jgi:peroxiredoxin